jgi:hypothetical protein
VIHQHRSCRPRHRYQGVCIHHHLVHPMTARMTGIQTSEVPSPTGRSENNVDGGAGRPSRAH